MKQSIIHKQFVDLRDNLNQKTKNVRFSFILLFNLNMASTMALVSSSEWKKIVHG